MSDCIQGMWGGGPQGEPAPKHGASPDGVAAGGVCRTMGCAQSWDAHAKEISWCMIPLCSHTRVGFCAQPHPGPAEGSACLTIVPDGEIWLRAALEAPARCCSCLCPAVHQEMSWTGRVSLPGLVFNGSGRAPGFCGLSQWHSRAWALGEEEQGAGGGKGERRQSWELLTDLLFMECRSSLVDTIQMAAISW